MVIRRNSKRDSNSRRPSQKGQQRERRGLFLENLEDRRLLHAGGHNLPPSGAELAEPVGGFEVIGAQLNDGSLLHNGDVLNQSPRDITLHFAHDVMIDGSSLDGVVLLQNGIDGKFSRAAAVTGLGTSAGQVQLSFSALVDGVAGNGIELVFTRSDHENNSGPAVQYEELDGENLEAGEVHTRIVVDLNTNQLNPTTAGQIVDALSTHVNVAKVLEVEVVEGDPETVVSVNPVTTYSPVRLSGSDDVAVAPGYLGVESDGHDVVFRFRESLQDGDYRLVVNGGGSQPLRSQNGGLFLNGESNQAIDFSIDRGPQVLAVVPQPVVRDSAGMLTQHRDQVHVYFNEDDLDATTAETPALYQLIFSANTLSNTDDVVHIPNEVEYSPEMDMAVLTFAQPLDELDGGGVYRLRVGDMSALPEAPMALELSAEAASTFSEALSLGKNLQVNSTGAGIKDGQSIQLVSEGGQSLTLEFDEGILLNVEDAGVVEGDSFVLHHGSQSQTFEFDGNFDVQAGNYPIELSLDDVESLTEKIVNAISDVDMGITPTNLGDGLIHLDGNDLTWLDVNSAPILSFSGSPGVTAGAVAVSYMNHDDFTSEMIAQNIVRAVEDAALGIEVKQFGNRVAIVGADIVRNTDLTVVGDLLNVVDGDVITIDGGDGRVVNLEFDTGVIIDTDGAVVQDGETFTITADGVEKTFEFELDGLGLSNQDHIPVNVSAGYDLAIYNAISIAFPGVFQLVLLGDGQISMGVEGGDYSVDMSGVPSVSASGSMGVGQGNVAITVGELDRLLSQPGIATLIAGAVNNSGVFEASVAGQRIYLDDPANLLSQLEVTYSNNLEQVLQSHADVEVLGLDSMILSSSISSSTAILEAPGSNNEPGHRQIRAESHLAGEADLDSELSVYSYSFPLQYGTDPSGNVLLNGITEKQKERAREIFEIYGSKLGVSFVETQGQGLKIVTGDMRALDPEVAIGVGAPFGLASNSMAIMDLQDFDDSGDDVFGGPWFQTAIHEIGDLLGMGESSELPAYTAQGSEPALSFGQSFEQIYVSGHDLVHGTHLYQAESNDIDIYELDLVDKGTLSIETLAERLADPSMLDTAIAVYADRVDVEGVTRKVLIAKNDDYFSEDSRLEISVEPGHYYIGVTSTGNTNYDPRVDNSGDGGTTEGKYDLRLSFKADPSGSLITDVNGNQLDGDGDGVAGGTYNFWFNVTAPSDTVFVDKTADPDLADGSIDNPFTEIDEALAVAESGDIVRVIGNSGDDDDLSTAEDNAPYLIGFDYMSGGELADGGNILIPNGVTLMVDAGVVIKSRRGRIAVGSSSEQVDRSRSALQILGVPRVFDVNGSVIRDADAVARKGAVHITSLFDDSRGLTPAGLIPPGAMAEPGDWGGIDIRNDIDKDRDDRFLYGERGIFLTTVSNAEIAFGGGKVVVDGKLETVAPIQLHDARPNIVNNVIESNADAAISASPNSFEETNYNTPFYQAVGFTLDYDRVGPEIHGNSLVENSINGLFVRVDTDAGMDTEVLTVAAGWDDDIVHVLTENLKIAGTPGGHFADSTAPPMGLVVLSGGTQNGGELPAGQYTYRMTYVDADGNESASSDVTHTVDVIGPEGAVNLTQLPTAMEGYVGRRLYRSQANGVAPYLLVTDLNASATSFVDLGGDRGAELIERDSVVNYRLDGSLVIKPGVVLKLDGARIDVGVGAQLLAEGRDGSEIIMTSVNDRRFGASGSFDTVKQGSVVEEATAGDWGGLYASPASRISIDHSIVAYGGGTTRIEGDFASFNVVEVQQAEARIANSKFEDNADGMGTPGDDRIGRGSISESTIFVRGSETVIIKNELINNLGPAISIDVNSLNARHVTDMGRSTPGGFDPQTIIQSENGDMWDSGNLIEGVDEFYGIGNQGALIRDNVIAGNSLNGMHVRGGTLTTEGVWDDTDIVHVVFDTIYVTDFHTAGGLRLESAPDESLVVKLDGDAAGFTATGNPLDIRDRIGGALSVVGRPGKPVVITSLYDDTVGAGYMPDGMLQVDTNGDSIVSEQITEPQSASITVTYSDPSLAGGNVDAAVQEAIAILEDTLLDPVSLEFVMNRSDLGPGIAGGMWSTSSIGIYEYDVVRDAMVDDASATEKPLVSQLPEYENLQTVPADSATDRIYITRGNAKALDLDLSQSTWSSACGTIMCDGFFEIDDQYTESNPPRVDLIVHEMGHALGFVTAVRYPWGHMSPMDMYRLEPGRGAVDFETAPRVADMGRDAVFYDGIYDPIAAGVTGVPGIGLGDIPMSTGDGGDGFQPSHFKNEPLIGGVELGIMDPQLNATLADPILFPNDISVLGLIGWDVTSDSSGGGQSPREGDWNTVLIDAHAHDRNVQAVIEGEIPGRTDSSSRNDNVHSPQYLGALAGREHSSDDNQRLGFEVHGLIETPGDADVYAFAGIAGTEVWFDIDNTTASLDTVVSILDANGEVIASSDDSVAETVDPTLLENNRLPERDVNPLNRAVTEIKDHWTTNPKDAGLRIVLPGTPGLVDTYFVKVASKVDPVDDEINGGRGNYELQIRLRELDEIAGSSVWYSDIRYGTAGVTVTGAPLHSPLSGEASESNAPNEDIASAQMLGNLLASDRATLSTAGRIDGAADVDFYDFEISYQSVGQSPTGAAVMLDLDYADGFARVDSNLSLFDAAGNLVYVGSDSNIADDRPAPLNGLDLDDLSRGTVGPHDPFVGTIELPVGSYSAAVAPTTRIPVELQQFTEAVAANPLLRLEPNLSVNRIAEDRLDIQENEFSTFDAPKYPILINEESIVPYHLGDVALYVTTDLGLGQTGVYTIDPYTSFTETVVHNVPVPFETADMAIRPDGAMFAFRTKGEGIDTVPDEEVGNYIQIDTGDGAATIVGDDGLTTGLGPGEDDCQGADHGMHYEAMAYGVFDGATEGYAVGHRPYEDNDIDIDGDGVSDWNTPGAVEPDESNRSNILYRFDPETGEVLSDFFDDRDACDTGGVYTNKVERGVLDTSVDTLGRANKWLLSAEATLEDVVTGLTTSNLKDGDSFSIDDADPLTVDPIFEFNTGPEVYITLDPANDIYIHDGDTFVIDNVTYEFDTGEVLVVDAENGAEISAGSTVRLIDNLGDYITFEFTQNGNVSGNNLPVLISDITNQQTITLALIAAINEAPFNVTASVLTEDSNRITLEDTHSSLGALLSGSGISIEGALGTSSGGNAIYVEENSTLDEFTSQLRAGFSLVATIDPGMDGPRFNFAGATEGDFTNIIARGVFEAQFDRSGLQLSSGDLTNSLAFPIIFHAEDTEEDIANRAMNAIIGAGFSVTTDGGIVELDPNLSPVFKSADTPLRVGGSGPGGEITGITFIDNEMYAVSDAGGFYQVLNYRQPLVAELVYIGSSAPALQDVRFVGLTSGPIATEGGRYQDVLFGIDVTGNLYAFDTDGIPAPVFFDGATKLDSPDDININQIEGIHFSTLEENPWGITDERGLDPGHGVATAFDGTRDFEPGGNSLHFVASNGAFDYPGGAYGSVESRRFSLEGYSPEDKPILYFNYFLETEDASSIVVNDPSALDPTIDPRRIDAPALDSFRVFIGDELGQWKLLSTNNESDDPSHDLDERELNQDIQIAFDNTANWRQIRVPLDDYAGQSGLKLRFDYSSAGTMNVGDSQTIGSELRVLPASNLVDGAQIVIDDEILEVDLGYSLVAPTGATMVDGTVLEVDYGFGVNGTFEVDKDGINGSGNILNVNDSMTAAQVAEVIAESIRTGVSLSADVENVGALAESNDTIATAFPVDLSSLPGTFEGKQGKIGDNSDLTLNPDSDVDFYSIALTAGSTINVNTNTFDYVTPTNTYLRIFDINGTELVNNDNAAAPGEDVTTDSYIEFTAPLDGQYFIGVSGFGNQGYNPTTGAFVQDGASGFYDIQITLNTESGIVQVVDNRINLPGAIDVVDNGTGLLVTGSNGVSLGTTALTLHAGLNAAEVAQETAEVLEDIFAAGTRNVVKTHNEIVRIIRHEVTDNGPFGITESLPGDFYGSFYSNVRGQNNGLEGVYVDDIVIGFAERGELVTNAVGDAAFVANSVAGDTDIESGEYQLELRRGTQYVAVDEDNNLRLVRSFDTNDRLSQSISLVASNGFDILDGQTFELGDGTNLLTFEYKDINSPTLPTPGNVVVSFEASETNAVLARRLRDLINSDAVQNVLDITAALSGGDLGGDLTTSEDTRIHIYGNADVDVTKSTLEISPATMDANRLRDVVVGDGLRAVGDAVYTGGEASAALFSGGFDLLGMDSGIILSTGNAGIADDSNFSDSSTSRSSGAGESDLNNEFEVETLDSTVLEFEVEFDTTSDLFVNFVFASEEYNELANTASNDVLAVFIDNENIALTRDGVPVSVNSINGGQPIGANARNGDLYNNNSLVDDGLFLTRTGFDGFTDLLTATKSGVTPGIHRIKIAIGDVSDNRRDSAIFVQAGSIATTAVSNPVGGILGDVHDFLGDRNTLREQGQIIIHGNKIQHQSDFGVVVDATSRDQNGNPIAGPVRNLRELNTFNLVPGATLTNNVIAHNGDGGIQLVGGANGTGDQAPVSMARVINNTIVGEDTDIGIHVGDNLAPTLLNNVVSGFATGIQLDVASEHIVVGGTVYHNNAQDLQVLSGGNQIGLGSFPIVLDSTDILFVGADKDNFYPASGSELIDSSIDSFQDRSVMTTVKGAVGIGTSPILAPGMDALGQVRVDDPTVMTPNGLGGNVFVDRGAIDRSDFVGPRAMIVDPVIYSGQSADIPTQNVFELKTHGLSELNIKLVDGTNLLDSTTGSGIDDDSIDTQTVKLYRDGDELELGKDYQAYYDATNDIIKLRPVSGLFETDSEYLITLSNIGGYVLEMKDGGQYPEGDVVTIVDSQGDGVSFEYDSGYTVFVRPSYTIVFPVDGGEFINDGEKVLVGDGTQTVTFEFDRNGVVDTNSIAVEYSLSSSAQTVVNRFSAALSEVDLGLNPRDLGNLNLMLGSHENHTLDVSGSSLIQVGYPSSVIDGECLIVVDDDDAICFELDSDGDFGSNNVDGDSHQYPTQVIAFDYSETQDEIAEKIATAIDNSFDSLEPTEYSGGLIHVGGDLGTHINTFGDDIALTILGTPGTTVDFGITVNNVTNLIEGTTFTISSQADNFQRFEFTQDEAGVTDNNHAVVFNENTTVESLASTIAQAIGKTSLGLQAVTIGGGDIALHGSTPSYATDLEGTPLTQYGTPGAEANVPLPYEPHSAFTAQDMADMVATVITDNDDLEGITARATNDSVVVDGAAMVVGGTILNFTGVQDIAGNKLQNNRDNGTTAFTLNLTSGMDHADALGYSNASHEVLDDLRLGNVVDVEPNPLSNEDATGDLSDDGVTFNQMLIRNGIGEVDVVVNGVPNGETAFVNAWLDQDGDGLFDGDTEQIINAEPVGNGTHPFSFSVNEDATIGNAIARFRLSYQETVSPSGSVESGEVEDYQRMIFGSGWQNPLIVRDVNQDGSVSPIDALMVINYLNRNGSGMMPLPTIDDMPPPFYDVNGNNYADPGDAVMIINCLNFAMCDEPEDESAEAEGEFVPSVASATGRSNVGTLTVVHDVSKEPQIDLERVREQQFSEFSVRGLDRLDDLLTEIAEDVGQSGSDDLDEFFANIRFE